MTRFYVLLLTMCMAVPSTCAATEVRVTNLGNASVYVALAWEYGSNVAGGWREIKVNQEFTFKAADEHRMRLRIKSKGQELKWSNLQNYLYFPVHPFEGFNVTRGLPGTTIFRLNWGGKSQNINKNDALPKGWERKRFFLIGNGNHHLVIKP